MFRTMDFPCDISGVWERDEGEPGLDPRKPRAVVMRVSGFGADDSFDSLGYLAFGSLGYLARTQQSHGSHVPSSLGFQSFGFI